MTTIINWTGASGRTFTTRVMTSQALAFAEDIADAGGSIQRVEQEV